MKSSHSAKPSPDSDAGKAGKEKAAAPPTPQDVAKTIEKQRAAVPGQGPKNKGRVG